MLFLGLLRQVSFYPSLSITQGFLCKSNAISRELAGHKSVFVYVWRLLNQVPGAVPARSEAPTRSFLLLFILGVVRRQGLPASRGAVMLAAFLELTLRLIIINVLASIRIST